MKPYSTLLSTAGSLMELETLMAEVNQPTTQMRARTFQKCKRAYSDRSRALTQDAKDRARRAE